MVLAAALPPSTEPFRVRGLCNVQVSSIGPGMGRPEFKSSPSHEAYFMTLDQLLLSLPCKVLGIFRGRLPPKSKAAFLNHTADPKGGPSKHPVSPRNPSATPGHKGSHPTPLLLPSRHYSQIHCLPRHQMYSQLSYEMDRGFLLISAKQKALPGSGGPIHAHAKKKPTTCLRATRQTLLYAPLPPWGGGGQTS